MKNKIYIAIICAFSIVFAVSSGFLIKHYCDSAKQAEMYDNLIEVVETEPEETTELMNYSEEKTFIPEYQELYLQNNDMVGWIKVEDTKINYPVMQSKDNPNFYLKHGFDKAYTDYGCPYVQENCDMELPSDNIIIYGHHMNDGSMFAGLMKFKDKSFWEKHKTVSFDTLTDRQTYEVIAVFKTVVYTDSPDSFKYYQFVNADTIVKHLVNTAFQFIGSVFLGRTAVGIYRPLRLFFCCDIRLLHSLGCDGSLIYCSYRTFCIVFRFNISHTIPPSYAG